MQKIKNDLCNLIKFYYKNIFFYKDECININLLRMIIFKIYNGLSCNYTCNEFYSYFKIIK